MDLSEFAGDNTFRGGHRSWYLGLPKETLDECVDGYLKGISISIIVRWLLAEGHEGATDDKVRRGILDTINNKD